VITDQQSFGPPPPADLGIPGIADAVQIGEGGFARVYRARKLSLNQPVAVKVLKQPLDTPSRQRFDREVQAMVQLFGNPGIVGILDAGYDTADHAYIVMEYMQGGSLAAMLHGRGPLDWRQATALGDVLAQALEAAHSARVLHCDIKPENVFFTQSGTPKLGDFGLATLADRPIDLQYTQNPMSLVHTAPEVVLHNQPRSYGTDVYALAVTLIESMLGWPAFAPPGEDLARVYQRLENEPPPDLRPKGVPDAVCRVLEKAVAKRPEQRYASAGEFRAALQQAVLTAQRVGGPPAPVPRPWPERLTGWLGANRAIAAGIAVAVALAAGLGIFFAVRSGPLHCPAGEPTVAGRCVAPAVVSAATEVAPVSPARLADALDSRGLSPGDVPGGWAPKDPQLGTYRSNGLIALIEQPISGPAAAVYVDYYVFDNPGDASSDAANAPPEPVNFKPVSGRSAFSVAGLGDSTTCAISQASSEYAWSCVVVSANVETFVTVQQISRDDAKDEPMAQSLTLDAIRHLAAVARATPRAALAAPPGGVTVSGLYGQVEGSQLPASLLPVEVSAGTVTPDTSANPPDVQVGLQVSSTGQQDGISEAFLDYYFYDSAAAAASSVQSGWYPTDATSQTGTSFDDLGVTGGITGFPAGTDCSTFPAQSGSYAVCYVPYGDVVIAAGTVSSLDATSSQEASNPAVIAATLARAGMMHLDQVDGASAG
jgi:tRNA A-37 threonylcarbamoyl transferase component Bud32